MENRELKMENRNHNLLLLVLLQYQMCPSFVVILKNNTNIKNNTRAMCSIQHAGVD